MFLCRNKDSFWENCHPDLSMSGALRNLYSVTTLHIETPDYLNFFFSFLFFFFFRTLTSHFSE